MVTGCFDAVSVVSLEIVNPLCVMASQLPSAYVFKEELEVLFAHLKVNLLNDFGNIRQSLHHPFRMALIALNVSLLVLTVPACC